MSVLGNGHQVYRACPGCPSSVGAQEQGIIAKNRCSSACASREWSKLRPQTREDRKTPLSCRTLVLRRANEVLDALVDLARVWAFSWKHEKLVQLLVVKLRIFLSNKTFDIYSQSPWVAGSQMSAISDLSLFVGLEILGRRNCFGAVIHLYNILQQVLAEYAEIPILEHLKALFRSKVFSCNQDPRRGFGNIFDLFRGGVKTCKDPETGIRMIGRDQ